MATSALKTRKLHAVAVANDANNVFNLFQLNSSLNINADKSMETEIDQPESKPTQCVILDNLSSLMIYNTSYLNLLFIPREKSK